MIDLPPEIIETAYANLAIHLKAAGLRIEDHFRVSDEGMAVTHKAAAVIKQTVYPMEVPSNDSLDGMGIPRDGSFMHPLCEVQNPHTKEGLINMWGSASLMVTTALGWLPDANSDTAKRFIKEAIALTSPTTSPTQLMAAARYSDPALLKLIGLVKDGLDRTSEQVLKS